MQPYYSALGLGLRFKDQENTHVNLIIHGYIPTLNRFPLTGTIKPLASHARYVLIWRPSTHWEARLPDCTYSTARSQGFEQPAGTVSHMTASLSSSILWAQPPESDKPQPVPPKRKHTEGFLLIHFRRGVRLYEWLSWNIRKGPDGLDLRNPSISGMLFSSSSVLCTLALVLSCTCSLCHISVEQRGKALILGSIVSEEPAIPSHPANRELG